MVLKRPVDVVGYAVVRPLLCALVVALSASTPSVVGTYITPPASIGADSTPSEANLLDSGGYTDAVQATLSWLTLVVLIVLNEEYL